MMCSSPQVRAHSATVGSPVGAWGSIVHILTSISSSGSGQRKG